jgi:hypothetical protein
MHRLALILVMLFSFAALPERAMGAGGPIAISGPVAEPSQPVAAKKEGKTGIEWAVSPSDAIVFLDGKKLGEAGKLEGKVTSANPGKHSIKLVKGGDEQEMDVKVTKGQVVRVEFSFSE